MMHLLVCTVLLSQSVAGDAPPEHVRKYLARCEAAKAAAIQAKADEVRSLAGQPEKQRAAAAELTRLQAEPAPLVPLPLPPQKGDVGIFEPVRAGDGRGRKSVTVLAVVDEDEAIVRAWFLLNAGDDPSFVDLWIQGIDTADLSPGNIAKLPQVFHVTGNKLFDTTCGKRSLPLLEPIDIEPFRQR